MSPAARMREKVGVVTGAGSGIGEATARRFAAEGARLVLFDLNGEEVERVAADLGATAVSGDAADEADAQSAVDAAIEHFGRLDALVCCAGATHGMGMLGELDEAAWNATVRANLDTAVASVKAALPALIEQRGTIVIVSSVGALSSGPRSIAYQTAKAALLGFVRSVAVDYGPEGVRINAVCPGRTLTPMVTRMSAEFAAARGIPVDQLHERLDAPVPLRRAADPEEIAAACLFLASAEASFMTGSVVVADGGQMALNVGVIPFL
jgi:meso-butanediol dehydrogenase / (S,S)-butanediol dehydrogenase / diacetyl reductase